MPWLRRFLLRLAELFRRAPRDAELSAELDSHLRLHIEGNIRRGMSAEEARRDALIKLSGITQIQEACRERRSLPFLETLLSDIRFAARLLRKNPGFTATAIVSQTSPRPTSPTPRTRSTPRERL